MAAVTNADTPSLQALVAALAADYEDCAGYADPAGGVDAAGLKPLQGLVEVFNLDALAVRLLLIAAAPDIDANLALAYDLFTGVEGRGRPTIGLALELADVPTADPAGFRYLGPRGELRLAGLMDVLGEGPWLYRTMRVPDRVSAHLLGSVEPDPQAAAIIAPAVPLQGATSGAIARAIADGLSLVWVRSPLGTAGASAAAGAFRELGIDCLTIDLALVPSASSLPDVVAASGREAALSGRGLVVTGADALVGPGERNGLEVLAQQRVPIVAVGTRAWNPGWLHRTVLNVEAPTLTLEERTSLWQGLLGELPDEAGRVELMSLRLTPEEIDATIRYARRLAAMRDQPLDIQLLRDAARERSAATGVGAGRVALSVNAAPPTFDDLVVPERTLAELHRIVAWVAHRDAVLARGGTHGSVHGSGGRGGGLSALFAGGPGTGKTLAAQVIAAELNLELFQVDLSTVIDKYIGETEKNLEKIFHEAESRNVVLFFDEADALFGSRSEVRDARDRYANQEVSYLLQRMEHFDGITVLASNLRGNLDKAFSRRMNFIVQFVDPDEAIRRGLWQLHIERAGPTDSDDAIDLDTLAAWPDLGGGDIRNIVLSATYDAVSAGSDLGMRHLREAAVREYAKLARRIPESLAPKVSKS